MSWFSTANTENLYSANTAAVKAYENKLQELSFEQFIENTVMDKLELEETEYREFMAWKRQSQNERLMKALSSTKLVTTEPFLYGAYAAADFMANDKRVSSELLKNRITGIVSAMNGPVTPQRLGLLMRDLFLLGHGFQVDKKFDSMFVNEFCKNLSIEKSDLKGASIEFKSSAAVVGNTPVLEPTIITQPTKNTSKSKKKKSWMYKNQNNKKSN